MDLPKVIQLAGFVAGTGRDSGSAIM
jgi:hypothetical protein